MLPQGGYFSMLARKEGYFSYFSMLARQVGYFRMLRQEVLL